MEHQDTRDSIERIVLRLGFTYTYQGTNNIIDAVLLCYQDPNALTAVTKRVYPHIAKCAGTKWRNVERNMRTAVEAFWKRGNRDLLNQMVGFDLRVQPSVGEVINYVTSYVRAHGNL